MTLLLDIDGVLIGWETLRPGSKSGFDDWTGSEHRNIRWISPDQLKLISESFSDIRWHTTWIEKSFNNKRLVDSFTETTGFGPFPLAVEPLERTRTWDGFVVEPYGISVPSDSIDQELHETLRRAGWWKLNAVAALLQKDALPGRVVWADDDIASFLGGIRTVLEHFDATERIALVSPQEVFTKEAILNTSEWVRGS